MVTTVVRPKPRVLALCQGGFVSRTPHIPQPDEAAALSKGSTAESSHSSATSSLSAHHLSVILVPGVITHRSPLAFMVDLHSARALITSIHQSDCYMKDILKNCQEKIDIIGQLLKRLSLAAWRFLSVAYRISKAHELRWANLVRVLYRSWPIVSFSNDIHTHSIIK